MRWPKILITAVAAILAPAASMQGSAPLSPATTPNPLAPSVAAEAPAVPATPERPGQAGEALTAEDVNAWLDGFLPYGMAVGDVAGAVVVVVKDGAILTQRGYGYANVAERKPVDPRRTLFRPGSVSKLFTWTAVMQLVEQGRLDLDADVNTYLDFAIPPYDGEPVTLRDIMTHTAGFEEQAKGIMASDPDALQSYETLLKQWVPERVFAPGTTPAYSNYATSLAGYIVERVSGEPFNVYIERHILAPLGMENSTFRQPLPPRLAPMMSEGYILGSGEPLGFEYVGPAPAGSLSSTGEDMANFMIAHLQGGAFGDNRILRPETAQMMHDTSLTLLPPLNRMELGFFETNINGRDVIAHLGDTQAFHSALHLFRDQNVGLYFSFNSLGKDGAAGSLRSALFERFADRYFPGPDVTTRVDPDVAAEHARMMSGVWSNSRASQSNFLHATSLLGQLEIGVTADGELSIPALTGANGQPRKWVEVAPFLWHDINSHERLAAQVVDGKVVRFGIDGIAPFMVFDRVPWYKSSAWLLPLLYVGLAALLLTVLLWPVAALVRRHYGKSLALDRRALLAHRLVRVAAVLILAVLIGWAAAISAMFASLDNLGASFDPVLWTLQILSFLVFIGGFAATLWNVWVVWRGERGWKARLWSVVLALAAFVVLWIAIAFNLIDFGVYY